MMSNKEREAWEEWKKEQDYLEDNDAGAPIPNQLTSLIAIIFGVVVCSLAMTIGGKFGLGLFLGGAAVLFLAGINFIDGL